MHTVLKKSQPDQVCSIKKKKKMGQILGSGSCQALFFAPLWG